MNINKNFGNSKWGLSFIYVSRKEAFFLEKGYALLVLKSPKYALIWDSSGLQFVKRRMIHL